MKTMIFTLCMLATCLNLQAQIIFQEDFDGVGGPTAGGAGTYSFPSGWFLRNVDNRTPEGQVAYVNEAWERREDFNFSVVDSCAFSTSWYSPVGPADDWMWTPAIAIQDNCILRWNAVAYDPAFRDGYEVRVMVAPEMPTGGTGVLGNQVSASTLLLTIEAENSSWTARTLDLAAYEGQTVYIGFRNNSNDKFVLLIDDVVVERLVEHDARLVSTDMQEYSQSPVNQDREFTFSATTTNIGVEDITDVTLHVTVFDESNASVFSSSSAPLALLGPGGSANLSATSPFVPASPGIYRTFYDFTIDEEDLVPSNDTVSKYFTISDTVFARDNEIQSGVLGIGAGNGYLGQEYAITAESSLSSISIYAGSHIGPHQLGAAVFRIINNAPEASPIFTAVPITIAANALPQWYVFDIPGGIGLNPEDTIMIAGEEIDSTMIIGQTTHIFTPGTVWVDWSGSPFPGWANIEQFGAGFAKTLMIRANIQTPSCDDGVQNGDEEGVDCGGSCGPCPAPNATCGVITVYVNPNAPVYDGPGTNNIWWIPAEDLDGGSTSSYMSYDLQVRRYLSTLTFDWTTAGACLDATPNGGSLSTADKGTVYRDCLPVRNADFNVWKLYQLRIQDAAGSDQCAGTYKVVPQSPALSGVPTLHYVIPFEERLMQHGEMYESDEDLSVSEFVILPNPGLDFLNVRWSAETDEEVEMTVTDIAGNIIARQELTSLRGNNLASFDMSGYMPGVYVVFMQTSEMRISGKWIKSH